MKRNLFVGLAAMGIVGGMTLPAFAADEYTLADGVLTFDVDVADYPEAAPYEYTTALSGVTSIVKKGTGAVSLGATATANTFTGTMTVEAGFLMGWKPRFGRQAVYRDGRERRGGGVHGTFRLCFVSYGLFREHEVLH